MLRQTPRETGSLAAMFESQADRSPHAPALLSGADVLSFRQLDRMAASAGGRADPSGGSGLDLVVLALGRLKTRAEPAYVVHTAGATGAPAAVRVSQDNAGWAIDSARRHLGLTATDRSLVLAPHTAPDFYFQVFATMLAGGSSRLPSRAELADPARLAELAAATTVLQGPPAMLDHVLRVLDTACPLMRHVVVSGAAPASALRHRLRAAFPSARLTVAYGAAETTLFCAMGELARADPDGQPIGSPLPGATVVVMDGDGRPVPDGVDGELWIGGPGVGAGARPDGFVTHDGQRFFRTGDLGLRRDDGTVALRHRTGHVATVRGLVADLGRVERTLAAAPGVLQGVVAAGRELTAYVQLDDAAVRRIVARRVDEARIAQWHQVFDAVFSTGERVVDDDGMDITGWHASHDGTPISFADMRSWLAATIDGLRSRLPPNPRVLEIGCATGLVLFELASECARYVGVDFSAPALAELRRRVGRRDLPQVELYEADAAALPPTLTGFDAVVLASVAQYLPGEEHLRRVLVDALDRVTPGGFVLVGDVRSLPLLDTLTVRVAGAHAGDANTVLATAAARAATEDELVVHPAFFAHLADRTGAVVEIEPRGGRRRGELTGYRYDVILRSATDPPVPVPVEWHSWRTANWTMARVEALLATSRPAEIGLVEVPHLLLVDDLRAHAALAARAGAPGPEVPPGDAVLPDDLRQLARRHGYRAALSCARGAADGTFDVWLTRTDVPERAPQWPRPTYRGPLTNDPAGREAREQALAEVREYLAEHLAEYLVPRSLVSVDRFPTTSHWRIDRAGTTGRSG